MSKLIRDPDQREASNEEQAPLLLPLSNSAVVSHLKACQHLAAEHSKEAFKKYLHTLDDALTVEISNAKSNQESSELAEIQRELRQNATELERYFCGYLSEGFVKFKKKQLNTSYGGDSSDSDSLSLVDNEELEETISISSISQRADSYYAEPLWALNQRFAVLNEGEHVTESNNPASPIQYCDSLRRALKLLPLNSKTKSLAYKVYDDQVLALTKLITEDINAYLKQHGILPHLKYSLPTGAAPKSQLADSDSDAVGMALDAIAAQNKTHLPDPTLSPEEYQHSLLQAIRGLQTQVHPGQPLAPGEVIVPAADLVSALQAVQGTAQQAVSHFAEGEELVPVDISHVIDQIREQLKEEEKDGQVDKNDMHTIDLVGMVFEYMLNDENLPDSIKTLLSYLHTPFLKIAFIDPGFFEKTDHPARLLLNNLAEAGSRWVNNKGDAQFDIYNKIKLVVDRILKEFDNDLKVITGLLLEFSSYTKNIMRRQELMEKRATEKAQGEEKLREVKLRVNNEIRKRTDKVELPSAVLLFLLQPWSDYLSFALLRFGEKSTKWHKALALVDDVLWSIEPKSTAQDKNRQLEMHDELISAIESGFETIGFDQVKGKKLADAISSLIKLAIQSKKAEPAPMPMRDKLEKIAAEKAGTRVEDERQATPEEAQMVESLKMIEFGTWLEFRDGRRLKVAWYNARTSHYMLVDQMGKRQDMISGLALARKMIGGETKIVSGSSKPFFERALENIFHKLNEKAGTSVEGATDE
ncbi:DUF1631 family protein [Teredinibacter sp. KSP-S5-2]|uniref:DUF1631 family protein n=1 Tax=Teredinibacter sp. KSP-S5-2 TaxID=3034506 RepID=UPI002934ED58|nr:DUF1631 family protein [Teredinibacter sp. KSP-S5-2]WNO09598.1 DUF1631 family protein [Teredinibacter sp. KSP-S5-2]